jgi:hypothetical protein
MFRVIARRVFFPPKQSSIKWWMPLNEIIHLTGDCFDGKAPSRNDIGRGRDCLVVLLIALICLLSSCAPAEIQSTPSQVVNVYATSAAGPWLTKLFDCAPSSVAIRLSDSQSDFDIRLQLGEPEDLTSPAYQINVEDILIVTHRESSLENMTIDKVQGLFAGQGDPSMQVWVYSSDNDIQKVFEQAVMAGRSVTSSARLAVSPGQMSDALSADVNAVGILPSYLIGDARFIYTIPNVPVLAITKTEPNETLKSLIACLQK